MLRWMIGFPRRILPRKEQLRRGNCGGVKGNGKIRFIALSKYRDNDSGFGHDWRMKISASCRAVIVSLGLICIEGARANNSFKSELSHFSGNAVIASATTIVVNKYRPEIKRPALTGFIVSTSEAILGEAVEVAAGGKFSTLDVAAGALGAATGAYVTHQWYIVPKIEAQKGQSTYGIVATRKF